MSKPTSASGPRYLTLESASALLDGTPTESIRFWIWQGRIKGYRPGSKLLVREDELRSFVESRETRKIRAQKPRAAPRRNR
jgi:excisionase family DNA binding protein